MHGLSKWAGLTMVLALGACTSPTTSSRELLGGDVADGYVVATVAYVPVRADGVTQDDFGVDLLVDGQRHGGGNVWPITIDEGTHTLQLSASDDVYFGRDPSLLTLDPIDFEWGKRYTILVTEIDGALETRVSVDDFRTGFADPGEHRLEFLNLDPSAPLEIYGHPSADPCVDLESQSAAPVLLASVAFGETHVITGTAAELADITVGDQTRNYFSHGCEGTLGMTIRLPTIDESTFPGVHFFDDEDEASVFIEEQHAVTGAFEVMVVPEHVSWGFGTWEYLATGDTCVDALAAACSAAPVD